MRIKEILCASVLFFVIFTTNAANPLFTNIFTADPAALVYDDKLYLYTGHDEAAVGGTWFRMLDWHVFSSSNMVNWTDHGACLTLNKFNWASGDAWAGHCIYRNGKFYWYVSVSHKTKGGHAIGVAVGNSPTGPFTDPRGSAIITTDMTPGKGDFDDIDPAVFIDDNGDAYMYWGNGTLKYVKLNSDLISFSGPIVTVNLPGFGEAPWVHKRNGIYYLSYSSGLPSTIEYATSSSPTGPWTHKGRILKPVQNCETSHQAIVQFRDQWYLVYHNGALPTGGNHRRSVCIDYLYYNADGTIKEVIQTTTGVKISGPVSAVIPLNVNNAAEKTFTITSGANGVNFSLPNSFTLLTIYNINGQKIVTWSVSSNKKRNVIFWDAKQSNGVPIKKGQYIAVASTDKGEKVRAFVLKKQ